MDCSTLESRVTGFSDCRLEYQIGRAANVNPLIYHVNTASIRGLTFPARLLYGDFHANGSWFIFMENTLKHQLANRCLTSEQHESLKNAICSSKIRGIVPPAALRIEHPNWPAKLSRFSDLTSLIETDDSTWLVPVKRVLPPLRKRSFQTLPRRLKKSWSSSWTLARKPRS